MTKQNNKTEWRAIFNLKLLLASVGGALLGFSGSTLLGQFKNQIGVQEIFISSFVIGAIAFLLVCVQIESEK